MADKNVEEENSIWSDIWAKIQTAIKNWWEADKAKIVDFLKALGRDLWEAIKEAFKKLLESKKK